MMQSGAKLDMRLLFNLLMFHTVLTSYQAVLSPSDLTLMNNRGWSAKTLIFGVS